MKLGSFSFGLVALSVTAAAYTACSSSSGDGGSAGAQNTGGSGGTGGEATGGSDTGGGGAASTGGGGTASTGGGGSGAAGGPALPPPPTAGKTTKCGSKMCAPSSNLSNFVTNDGCCFDEGTNTCGYSIMGSACAQADTPGVVTASCPSEPNPYYTPIKLQGCCRPDGICGLMEGFVAFGCSTINGAIHDGGAAVKCTYTGTDTLPPPKDGGTTPTHDAAAE